MKPKTKKFISLLRHDALIAARATACVAYDVFRFVAGAAAAVVIVLHAVFVLEKQTLHWAVFSPAYAYAATLLACATYKWLKGRWDDLPNETP